MAGRLYHLSEGQYVVFTNESISPKLVGECYLIKSISKKRDMVTISNVRYLEREVELTNGMTIYWFQPIDIYLTDREKFLFMMSYQVPPDMPERIRDAKKKIDCQ